MIYALAMSIGDTYFLAFEDIFGLTLLSQFVLAGWLCLIGPGTKRRGHKLELTRRAARGAPALSVQLAGIGNMASPAQPAWSRPRVSPTRTPTLPGVRS